MDEHCRKMGCGEDEQSNLDLISQLKLKSKKTALDQNGEVVYIMILDDDDRDRANDARAVAEREFDDECRRRPSGDRSPDSQQLAPALLPSEKRYIFIRPKEIARGGYGAVYRARLEGPQALNDRLCIKTGIHKQRYATEEEKEAGQTHVNKSLIREADCFQLLKLHPHDNIIKFHFYCESLENEVMIGLEHFEGEDLSKFIVDYCNDKEDRAIPTKHVHNIMCKSVAAVEHLQSLGICHCDIKPHNILYNCINEELKFIDFGSAIIIPKKSQGTDIGLDEDICVAGTPEYMAPEIFVNRVSCIDKQSDVYSLGTLFYRMLTLERPWHFIKEIKEQREKKNNSRTWELIEKQHKMYCVTTTTVPQSERKSHFTKLQERIMEPLASYYIKNSNECTLVKDMLAYDPSTRPSCHQITSQIRACDKITRQTSEISLKSNSSYSESSGTESSNIPLLPQLMPSGPSGSTTMNSQITRRHQSFITEAPAIPETNPWTFPGADDQGGNANEKEGIGESRQQNSVEPEEDREGDVQFDF